MLVPAVTAPIASAQSNREGERCTHLLDSTFLCTDGVPILELVLRKVELGYGDPVLNLMDRSLKLRLANGH